MRFPESVGLLIDIVAVPIALGKLPHAPVALNQDIFPAVGLVAVIHIGRVHGQHVSNAVSVKDRSRLTRVGEVRLAIK